MDYMDLGVRSRKTGIQVRSSIGKDEYSMEDVDEFFKDDESTVGYKRRRSTRLPSTQQPTAYQPSSPFPQAADISSIGASNAAPGEEPYNSAPPHLFSPEVHRSSPQSVEGADPNVYLASTSSRTSLTRSIGNGLDEQDHLGSIEELPDLEGTDKSLNAPERRQYRNTTLNTVRPRVRSNLSTTVFNNYLEEENREAEEDIGDVYMNMGGGEEVSLDFQNEDRVRNNARNGRHSESSILSDEDGDYIAYEESDSYGEGSDGDQSSLSGDEKIENPNVDYTYVPSEGEENIGVEADLSYDDDDFDPSYAGSNQEDSYSGPWKPGTRRSTRVKVPPLDYWRNEKIVYQRRTSKPVLDIEKIVTYEYEEDEEDLAKKSKKMEDKRDTESLIDPNGGNTRLRPPRRRRGRPRKTPKIDRTTTDGSNGIVAPNNPNYDILNQMRQKPDFKSSWLKEGIYRGTINATQDRRGDEIIAYAPDISQAEKSKNGTDEKYSLSVLFDKHKEHFASGMLKLPPGGNRKKSDSQNAFITFYVVQGIVEVTITGNTFMTTEGCSFQVSAYNSYSLFNRGKNEAKLFFVQVLVLEDKGLSKPSKNPLANTPQPKVSSPTKKLSQYKPRMRAIHESSGSDNNNESEEGDESDESSGIDQLSSSPVPDITYTEQTSPRKSPEGAAGVARLPQSLQEPTFKHTQSPKVNGEASKADKTLFVGVSQSSDPISEV